MSPRPDGYASSPSEGNVIGAAIDDVVPGGGTMPDSPAVPSYSSGISEVPLLGDTIGDNFDRTLAGRARRPRGRQMDTSAMPIRSMTGSRPHHPRSAGGCPGAPDVRHHPGDARHPCLLTG
jgi:hypothetical protein